MASTILSKICNDKDESIYSGFNSVPEYIESTLNDDKELYKYISIEDDPKFVENIIRDSTIKFGAPNEFNDPFEFMSVIGISSLNSTIEKLNELAQKAGKKYSDVAILRAYDDIVKYSVKFYRDNVLSKYGILCLSGEYDSLLMWAHYSNDHKGIIAIFQFDKEHSFYNMMMKVQYKKGITYFEIDNPKCVGKVWESISIKDPIWEYENEYRIINPPSDPNTYDGNGIKPFPRELLKGFIFGYKTSEKVRDKIIKMVSSYNPILKLFYIVLDENEIKLHKVPIV